MRNRERIPKRATSQERAEPPPREARAERDGRRSAQQLKRVDQQRLQHQLRNRHATDWLAEPGSEREKQLLREWGLHKPLDDPERVQIFRWLDNPDEQERRNALFWNSAKESVLGRVVYDNARKRHEILKEREWLVACFTSRGLQQSEIADLLGITRPTMDIAVRTLKDNISKNLGCHLRSLNSAVIASWFFGL